MSVDLSTLQTGDLLAVHEQGFFSWVIQTWTRSHFNHVALILRDQGGVMVVQATPDHGVAPMLLSRYLQELRGTAWVCTLDGQQATQLMPTYQQRLHDFMEQHYGDPYDWGGIWHYVIPWIHERKGQEYCSELAAEAYREIGFQIPDQLSPEQLFDQAIFSQRTPLKEG